MASFLILTLPFLQVVSKVAQLSVLQRPAIAAVCFLSLGTVITKQSDNPVLFAVCTLVNILLLS